MSTRAENSPTGPISAAESWDATINRSAFRFDTLMRHSSHDMQGLLQPSWQTWIRDPIPLAINAVHGVPQARICSIQTYPDGDVVGYNLQ